MRRSPKFLWIVLAVLATGLLLLILNDDAGSTFGFENDQFASLLTSGLLVTVLAAGIVASRPSFGEVTRNIAIWLFIVLAMLTGYSYRYELQDVASRVTAGLVPGSPLSVTDSEGNVTVTVEKTGSGHFEARALIDNKPVQVMVDTGASMTVLTVEDARAIGLDVEALNFAVPVSTANGVTVAARARAETIAIGAIGRGPLPILVAQPGALGQSLLGMNFMGTLSGYDVRGDRMVLRD
ncbi:TIGR02281 family clan AA aspartic protease [Tianweitania sp. BSSL-BM11]|uniref:TIGR02281 family clan AA aspartic protease n=1 Tax=Tianweitania aestuarii TaxID=2814886 RepID=A0ABS5RUT0_9HYPH|nr:TIGR02281 family clan AA aspartic protease [Tianweitania aestuarii]MBS9720761.1 TIGR02281 family clan AA aspartic protease [Tianweitania aestuarii]